MLQPPRCVETLRRHCYVRQHGDTRHGGPALPGLHRCQFMISLYAAGNTVDLARAAVDL